MLALSQTKDALRDEVLDLKTAVRRSFSALSDDMTSCEEQITRAIPGFAGRIVFEQLTVGGSPSVQRLCDRIDKLHEAMDYAGLRPTPAASSRMLQRRQVQRQQNIPSLSHPSEVMRTVDNAPLDGADLPSPSCGNKDYDGPSRNDDEREEVDGDDSPQQHFPTSSEHRDNLFTRHRTRAFCDPVRDGTSAGMGDNIAVRLYTIDVLLTTLLPGFVQAHAKLAAAKKWEAEAPNPLVGSVEGVLQENASLKRLISMETPSVSVAALPMSQFPHASSFVAKRLTERSRSPPPLLSNPSPSVPQRHQQQGRHVSGLPSVTSQTGSPKLQQHQGPVVSTPLRGGGGFHSPLLFGNEDESVTLADRSRFQKRFYSPTGDVPSPSASCSRNALSDPFVYMKTDAVETLRQREQTDSTKIHTILRAVQCELGQMAKRADLAASHKQPLVAGQEVVQASLIPHFTPNKLPVVGEPTSTAGCRRTVTRVLLIPKLEV